ncbi:MAG TPA: membrane dipeptidase [Clostridia bacterium]|nr:membrane dipeptidase [Clostridia bacterium]
MRYFDLHCDTITKCSDKNKELFHNDLHISLERAAGYATWAQFFAVWTPDKTNGDEAEKRFWKTYAAFTTQIGKNKNLIDFCGNAKDLEQAVAAGKQIAMLSIEGAVCLNGRLELIDEFYHKGVRLLSLTWNDRCITADGCMTPDAQGLTPFGREVIRRMGRLGMVADVSHLSEKGFWEIARLTDRPFVASHSNSAAVCAHKRNLTDDQLKEIVNREGLVGLNLYTEFIRRGKPPVRVEDLLSHIDHILSLGGENVLAIGSDFDGATMPQGIKGVEDMAKLHGMISEKFGADTADKIFFENAFRFFKTALTDCESCNNIIEL